MDQLPYPVRCAYAECGAGPFANSEALGDHITAEHLAEAVWDFAFANTKPVLEAERRKRKA